MIKHGLIRVNVQLLGENSREGKVEDKLDTCLKEKPSQNDVSFEQTIADHSAMYFTLFY